MNSYKQRTAPPPTFFQDEASLLWTTPKKKKKIKVSRESAWGAKYRELVKLYQNHNGNLKDIKQSAIEPTLYRWMVNQRNKRAGKGNHVALTERQIRLLDTLDFPWTPRNEWNDMYEELVELHKTHNDWWRRVEYKSRLYLWMETQRRKRAGKPGYAPLTNEQIELLDQIHFAWNPKQERQQAAWYDTYKELTNFYNKHGNLKVPSGSRLYIWMANQRRVKCAPEDGTPALTEEQIRLLDDIHFPWASTGRHESAWEKKYQELVKFQREHGHLNVKRPSSLYTWMVTQRQKRAGKGNCAPLTEEQIQRLEEIDFQWVRSKGGSGASHETVWHNKYEELANFYKTHGHLKVPRPSTLYTWMSKQRSKWRSNRLTEGQIVLMDKLNFQWEPRRGRPQRREEEQREKEFHFKGESEAVLE